MGFGAVCEPSVPATREFISNMDLRHIGCDNGRSVELSQNCVQWKALVLLVVNLRGSGTTESVNKTDLTE